MYPAIRYDSFSKFFRLLRKLFLMSCQKSISKTSNVLLLEDDFLRVLKNGLTWEAALRLIELCVNPYNTIPCRYQSNSLCVRCAPLNLHSCKGGELWLPNVFCDRFSDINLLLGLFFSLFFFVLFYLLLSHCKNMSTTSNVLQFVRMVHLFRFFFHGG